MVKEYNESKSIAYAVSIILDTLFTPFKNTLLKRNWKLKVYNIVLLGVIGGPVVGFLQATGVPGAVLVIEVVLIVLAFTFTLVSLFGRIIYRV